MAARVGILKPKRHQNATTTHKKLSGGCLFSFPFFSCAPAEWAGVREIRDEKIVTRWKKLSACVETQINFDFSPVSSRRNIFNKTFRFF
jgi:hypothetical protein